MSHCVMSNSEALQLVNGAEAPLGSYVPDRDLEGGVDVKEEGREDGGGEGCGCSNIEGQVQEKDLLCKEMCYGEAIMEAGREVNDDDGFRTPVSVYNRIVSAAECPPAPMKPKPVRWRRLKLSPSDRRCNNRRIGLAIHLSDEDVEAMFPEIVHCEAQNCKVKKARREEMSCKQ
ncbi:hypothetical protein SAY87_028419 [Trapa incisa]|uniref:Uncharacterized protein n=1 Tax=Trapa incisa TaxID=236973 RepID=A0AAN7KUV2_9MYRT|nr:hypothetical protein SAY87_028419 [Trapa incisa]